MSRREEARTLAMVFMAGVAGGFLGGAITSWLADGPEILGASWWEVMTAFGTVAAAFAAAYAAWIAMSNTQFDRLDRKRREELSAQTYILSINPDLHHARILFEGCGMNTLEGRIIFEDRKMFLDGLNILKSIQVISIRDASYEFARNVAGVRKILLSLNEAYVNNRVVQYSETDSGEKKLSNNSEPGLFSLACHRLQLCVDASNALLSGEPDWLKGMR
ncbi:hypothetical protein ACI0FN_00529 [Alcaligenes nematophilus]|uniref:hypothetical protein n=1 Tax=Alcaligenes nematophilus TaxID=2994643 RepID=UPI0038505932